MTNLQKLTDEERKQYFLARAITEGETRIQEGIDLYAQSVQEGTASAREEFKGNRYALHGKGGTGGGKSGGGGSTEISIYDNGIKESINTKIGVIDIMQEFPDLAEDIAKTDLETVKAYIKERLNLPKEKADILILAGGGHEYFARNSGIKYEDNTLYNDPAQQIMMDIETRKSETERYYKEISLDEIRARVNDPDWWYATRAMCAFALVVAEAIDAKYVVPTNIAMVYGLLNGEI